MKPFSGGGLETEMGAASERERRERADRNREPLDQLQPSHLPQRVRVPPDLTPESLVSSRLGDTGVTIG